MLGGLSVATLDGWARPLLPAEPVLTPDILPDAIPTGAPAPTSLTVAAPCVADSASADPVRFAPGPQSGGGRSPLVSCACLYQGQGCPKHISNPKQANFFRGLYAELEAKLQNYIDPRLAGSRAPASPLAAPSPSASPLGLYQGMESSFDEALMPSVEYCNKAPICSLLPTSFTKRDGNLFAELDTNHAGQSCGEFRRLNVKVRKGKPALVQFKSDLARGVGGRERSYFCGMYVGILGHHYRLLREELESTNAITLPPGGSAPHPCQKFAESFQAQSKRLTGDLFKRTNFAALGDELAQQKNIKDIWNCDANLSDLGDAAGSKRVSLTHLCGARASLIQAFTQLAVCKVSAGAAADNAAEFGDATRALASLKQVSEQVNTRCDGEIRRAKPKSETALTRLAQACYNREAPGAFRSLFESRWRPYAQ